MTDQMHYKCKYLQLANLILFYFYQEAIPKLLNTDKHNFAVTYYTDPVRQHQVVDKVSIRFSKHMIKHSSCIKHVKITGVEDRTPPRPIGGSSQTRGRSAFGQRVGGNTCALMNFLGSHWVTHIMYIVFV